MAPAASKAGVYFGTLVFVASFESYESVSVQDRFNLQLPKQECILGHWTRVFVPSFESCEREGKYSGLPVQSAAAPPSKRRKTEGMQCFGFHVWICLRCLSKARRLARARARALRAPFHFTSAKARHSFQRIAHCLSRFGFGLKRF